MKFFSFLNDLVQKKKKSENKLRMGRMNLFATKPEFMYWIDRKKINKVLLQQY